MNQPHPDRKHVERYFRYPTMIVRPGWAWTLSIAQALAVFATLFLQLRQDMPLTPENIGESLLEAVIFGGIVFAIGALIKFLILQLHKIGARQKRKSDLAALEGDVVQILKHDYRRAMKQMVRKAGIKPTHLREIGTPYHDPLESHLFDDAELRRFLGLLTDQSIRMMTPYGPEPSFAAIAADRLSGRGLFRAYYQPVRFICLFFTSTEIIFGDCVFDCRTGDMVTRIKRLPEGSFSGLQTASTETRHSIPADRLRDWLSEHQFTPAEEKSIAIALERYEKQLKQSKAKRKKPPESPYLLRRTAKYLLLNRHKGKPMTLPMQFKFDLVRGKGAKVRPPENTPFPLAAQARAARHTPPAQLSDTQRPLRSRVSFMEYRTRYTLLADLTAALMASGLCLAVMHTLSEQTGKAMASTDLADIEVERNGVDEPRLFPWQKLETSLEDELKSISGARFACVSIATTLKEQPGWRGKSLTSLQPGQALILLPTEDGETLPNGWQKIKIRSHGKTETGYITSDTLTVQDDAGAFRCSDRP